MVFGKYKTSFSESSHALPEGMHMGSDYPFKIAKIESVEGKQITVSDGYGNRETAKIIKRKGKEYFYLNLMSSFNRKPTRFKFHPFKDNDQPSVSTEGE